jgi:hypothetical protein
MRPKTMPRRRLKSVVSGSERGPGRPPVEDPKATVISLRLAQDDVSKLDDLVRHRGGGRSAVLRGLVAEAHARVHPKRG